MRKGAIVSLNLINMIAIALAFIVIIAVVSGLINNLK